jgi:hypothetical protein
MVKKIKKKGQRWKIVSITLEMVYKRPQKPREDQKYQKSLESPLFISKISRRY